MPPERKWAWTWLKKDKAYIKMMEHYESNYDFGKRYSNQKEVWEEVSIKVGMPANYCRRKWLGIKHNYLQLKYMIHCGRVTEDMVRKHIKTSKYLDGRLDFLDRYMFKLPEAKLSSCARNFFESVFGVFPNTQSGSSVEKLIKVKENSVIEVIKDYNQETGIEPMSILPNNEIDESDSSMTHYKETFVNFGIDQTVEKVYGTNDDSNDLVFVEPDILPNIQSTNAREEFSNSGMDQATKQEDPIGDNVVTNVTSSSLLKNILSSTKNEDTKSSLKPSSENNGDLARFLVKYTNTTIDREKDEDCNLKEYMKDLAEVLCRRLVPGKRKPFLSQIDLMVSEILEGT